MNIKNTRGTKVAAGALCLLSLGGAAAVAGPALAEQRGPTVEGQVQDYLVKTMMKFHDLPGYTVEISPYFQPCQCSRDYASGRSLLDQKDQQIPLTFVATTGGSCFFESSRAHWFVQLYDPEMKKAGRYEIWLDEGCMDYYAGLRTIDGNDKIDAHARPHRDVHDEQYIYFGAR